MKKDYTPPALEQLGSVLELTLATRTGLTLDGTYPAGTPLTDPILS